MRHRLFAVAGALSIVTVVVLAASVSVVGQNAGGTTSGKSRYAVPRTSWGDPNLEGIWTNEPTNTPMERPAKFAGREFLTDAEVAEKYKEALAQYQRRVEEEDPAGPRSTRDIQNVKGTVEEGIFGNEYNNSWMERAKKPDPQRVWRRTSLIVDPPDGKQPPLTLEALNRLSARLEARKGRGETDTWEDRNLNERCMTPGAATGLQGTFKIIQTPGWVTILPDGLQYARLVPTDGRAQVSPKIRGWFGRSRGHWEGETLVVDTKYFTNKLDGGPIMASRRPLGVGYRGSGETMHRIERYHRMGPDQMEYSVTTDDPNVFVSPYTVVRPMMLANDFQMLQSGCHEGNYGMPNSLSAARANEQGALKAAAEAEAGIKVQLDAMRKQTEQWMKEHRR